MKSTPSVAILTPHARYYGGVEQANRMLMTMLGHAGYATQVVSQELLGGGPGLRVRRRLFGLNRILARHFNRNHAASADVVICNGEFSLGVRHPAAINVFHGCYYGYAQGMRPCISKRAYENLLRMADQQRRGAEGKYVVAVSRTVGQILGQQGLKVDAVIDNAVDPEHFREAGADAVRGDRYLFVGSSDYLGKGFDVLEKLAALGVPIDCITAAAPRNAQLRWLGNIPNEDLPAYYQRYRVLLLPSRFEGSSLVVLEAMACGMPVVTTAVGSGPDIALEIPEFVVDGPWADIPEHMVGRLRAIEDRYSYFSAQARRYILQHHGYEDWKNKWLAAVEEVRSRAASCSP